MCGFATSGCCGCDCDPILLYFDSDGEGGLSDWWPTSDQDLTLVSRADVFCKTPRTPFFTEIDFGSQLLALDNGAIVRIMARVESTETDGVATLGDHCFVELSRSDDLVGVQGITHSDTPIWVRVGVCIDGVDTVLQSGTMELAREVFSQNLLVRFQSGLASSTGQIKYAPNSEFPLSVFYPGTAGFAEGDYFMPQSNLQFSGDGGTYLDTTRGKLYRLDDADHASDPASWSETDIAELDDAFLSAGFVGNQGASIYESQADANFATLPGLKLAIRVSNLSPGDHFVPQYVQINNAVSAKSRSCPITYPALNHAPVKRLTPLPVYSGSITGAVTGLIYPGWSTRVSGTITTVYPDMPYFGSGPAESVTPPVPTQGIIRQISWCKYGPITGVFGLDSTTPYYLYARITAEIKILWSQIVERRITYGAIADVRYAVGYSKTSWTLAQLLAGEHDITFEHAPETTHGGHAELAYTTIDTHLAPALTITLDPTPTGPDEPNRARLDVFELTIEVPVPQP